MSDNGVNAHEQPLTVADGIGTTRMPLGAIQADVDKHDATSASLQQIPSAQASYGVPPEPGLSQADTNARGSHSACSVAKNGDGTCKATALPIVSAPRSLIGRETIPKTIPSMKPSQDLDASAPRQAADDTSNAAAAAADSVDESTSRSFAEPNTLLPISTVATPSTHPEVGGDAGRMRPETLLALAGSEGVDVADGRATLSVPFSGVGLLRDRFEHRNADAAIRAAAAPSRAAMPSSASTSTWPYPPSQRRLDPLALGKRRRGTDNVKRGSDPYGPAEDALRKTRWAARGWFVAFVALFAVACGLSLQRGGTAGFRVAVAAFATVAWGGMTTVLFEAWPMFESVHAKAVWFVLSAIVASVFAWLVDHIDPTSSQLP